jgi:hypothetical protein
MITLEVFGNVLSIIIFIGGPIIPLLLLSIAIGDWHKLNLDPPNGTE